MIFEAQDKVIGENEYKVAPFSAIEALKLKATLLKYLSPAIGKALAGISAVKGKDLMNTAIDGGAISEALSSLFESLDEDTLMGLLKRLLRNVTAIIGTGGNGQKQAVYFVDGKEESFNIAFQGHILDVYKVVYFVLEVNYPDFFVLFQGRLTGTPPTTPSLKGRTGIMKDGQRL